MWGGHNYAFMADVIVNKMIIIIRGLRMKAKKCLYEGVILSTTLYGAEEKC